jgi:hypothetical protein
VAEESNGARRPEGDGVGVIVVDLRRCNNDEPTQSADDFPVFVGPWEGGGWTTMIAGRLWGITWRRRRRCTGRRRGILRSRYEIDDDDCDGAMDGDYDNDDGDDGAMDDYNDDDGVDGDGAMEWRQLRWMTTLTTTTATTTTIATDDEVDDTGRPMTMTTITTRAMTPAL